MKRIVVLLMVAALMLSISALPALAKTEVFHCKQDFGEFGGKGTAVFHEKDNKITGNCRVV